MLESQTDKEALKEVMLVGHASIPVALPQLRKLKLGCGTGKPNG
jgi:hypothetical protein